MSISSPKSVILSVFSLFLYYSVVRAWSAANMIHVHARNTINGIQFDYGCCYGSHWSLVLLRSRNYRTIKQNWVVRFRISDPSRAVIWTWCLSSCPWRLYQTKQFQCLNKFSSLQKMKTWKYASKIGSEYIGARDAKVKNVAR